MNPLLFLDIDGVLNDHAKLPSGYSGIQLERVHVLNAILDAIDDLRLVISSAWRYQVTDGAMTLRGFETLLLVHGVRCHARLHGVTDRDPVVSGPNHMDVDTWNLLGLTWRAEQIERYVRRHQPPRYAVVDDLPLVTPNFVQTRGDVGLTLGDAVRLMDLLRGDE